MHINITPLGPAQSVRVSQSLREVPELKRSQLIAGKNTGTNSRFKERSVRSGVVDCRSYFKLRAFVFRNTMHSHVLKAGLNKIEAHFFVHLGQFA